MTSAMFQGEGGYQAVAHEAIKSALPKPLRAMAQGSTNGEVMSDLQNMMANEQKQHQQAYQYAHGHNDHGMGQ